MLFYLSETMGRVKKAHTHTFFLNHSMRPPVTEYKENDILLAEPKLEFNLVKSVLFYAF